MSAIILKAFCPAENQPFEVIVDEDRGTGLKPQCEHCGKDLYLYQIDYENTRAYSFGSDQEHELL
jgi:hypothetical protein